MVAGANSLPICLLLAIPLAVGSRQLYPWLDPAGFTELLNAHQQTYFDVRWWAGRAVIYFVIWQVLARLAAARYREMCAAGDPQALFAEPGRSAFGLVLLCLSITFAAVDWVMSLEPRWSSTIYGATLLAGFAISGLAFLLVVRAALPSEFDVASSLPQKASHPYAVDLGNLLWAMLMLWAYFACSQFLIIWSGDLPRESIWYLRRMTGVWLPISIALPVLHFAIPFACLMSRQVKSRPARLAAVAGWLLVMRLLDLVWTILPAREPLTGWWIVCLPAATVTVYSLWLRSFFLARQALPAISFAWESRPANELPSVPAEACR